MPAEALREGVAAVLDYLRRKRVLHDPEHEVFTRFWLDGDAEIQQGYLPKLGPPVGTKMRRAPAERAAYVTQWLSERGDTTIRQIARKWGIDGDHMEGFLQGMFGLLAERGLLAGEAEGAEGSAAAARQRGGPGERRPLAADPESRRVAVPKLQTAVCTGGPSAPLHLLALRGRPGVAAEDADNYDLQLLDQNYSMLRPAEHTAMVPTDQRERLENLFKGDSEAVNALVCTPTLELGVDIGALDTVLHAQRAAAAGQLLAARRARRPAASHGRGLHLLQAGAARPGLLRRAAQAARRPGRPAGLQLEQRGHGGQARAMQA